jgi:hypothetical protein
MVFNLTKKLQFKCNK